jgi:hypothetical protein
MVYLAKKDGAVICHTDKAAMEQIDGISKPDMTDTNEEFEAAGGLVRLIDGEIVLGRTDEETAQETQREAREVELAGLKAEIAARDYRALKACKLGVELDSIYPGESAWYSASLDRIHELEETLGIN